jgi:hypothetical protein
MTLKACVHNGRLLVDEPTQLPEGTEIDLLPLDPGDWLDLRTGTPFIVPWGLLRKISRPTSS